MASYESSNRSIAAFKGHFNRAFDLLLKVKPRPTAETVEKSYARVQKQFESLFTSLDDIIALLENYDSTGESSIDVEKELHGLNTYYESILSEQWHMESRYVTFKDSRDISADVPTPVNTSSLTLVQTTATVRLSAFDPPPSHPPPLVE